MFFDHPRPPDKVNHLTYNTMPQPEGSNVASAESHLREQSTESLVKGCLNLKGSEIPCRDLGEILGKTIKKPNDEAVPKNDWYKKSSSDTSSDLE
nr:hypothetical protein [Tanacetum cinerariifolium]